MALGKQVEFKGILINDAYIKVMGFQGEGDKVTFSVGHFSTSINENSEIIVGELIDSNQFTMIHNTEGDNLLKQAYAKLKESPQYIGAVDC